MFGRLNKFLAVGILLLGFAACSEVFRYHGYAPTDAQLEELVVGIDTRGSVEDIVGPPSSTGVMNDGGWYYISSKIRHYAYQEARVVDRELVAISFDSDDVITNIERFGLADGRVIVLNRRVTELPVKGPGVLSQILGTLGNIDAGQILGGN